MFRPDVENCVLFHKEGSRLFALLCTIWTIERLGRCFGCLGFHYSKLKRRPRSPGHRPFGERCKTSPCPIVGFELCRHPQGC